MTHAHEGKEAWRELRLGQDEMHVEPAEGPDTEDDFEAVLLEM